MFTAPLTNNRSHITVSGNVFSDPLPNNRCHIIACTCVVEMCLPTRCLAMGTYVTIYMADLCTSHDERLQSEHIPVAYNKKLKVKFIS
jgi:hypothetical protein